MSLASDFKVYSQADMASICVMNDAMLIFVNRTADRRGCRTCGSKCRVLDILSASHLASFGTLQVTGLQGPKNQSFGAPLAYREAKSGLKIGLLMGQVGESRW